MPGVGGIAQQSLRNSVLGRDRRAVVTAGSSFPSKHPEQFSIWIRPAWKCWAAINWKIKTASIAPTAMWREGDPLSLATFSIVFYTLTAPIVYRKAHVLQCHPFGRYFAQHGKKRNLTKLLLSKPVLQTYLPSKKVTTRLIKRLSSTLSLSTFL